MKTLAACLLFSGAAQAAVIGIVPTESGRMEMHDSAGKLCVGPARSVQYIPRTGKAIEGCWRVHEGKILAVFLDGDAVVFPVEIIKYPTSL